MFEVKPHVLFRQMLVVKTFEINFILEEEIQICVMRLKPCEGPRKKRNVYYELQY